LLQVDPAAQVVQPVYPLPPHWPHLATVQPPVEAGVEAEDVEDVVRVDVTSVVVAGVLLLTGGGGFEPPPLQLKTSGPGTV
jgi:hypothetical protein